MRAVAMFLTVSAASSVPSLASQSLAFVLVAARPFTFSTGF
jgi:hypothetical protein